MAMQPQRMGTSSNCSMNPPSSTPMIKTNTVIVFDFDDTLFPTNKFKEINSRPIARNKNNSSPRYSAQSLMSRMSSTELKQWVELSWNLFNLLKIYINTYSHENICIVSASRQGWVQQALGLVYDIGYFKQISGLIFYSYKISIFHPASDVMKSFNTNKRNQTNHPI